MLTDGVYLLSWLRSLEDRVKRQTGGMGNDMGDMLKEVGLAEASEEGPEGKAAKVSRVWLHCVVGPKIEKEVKGKGRVRGILRAKAGLVGPSREDAAEEVSGDAGAGADEGEADGAEDPATTSAPQRRGFDVLLDAGLSSDEVAQMRRQFYESRGEEVPENLGDTSASHALSPSEADQ